MVIATWGLGRKIIGADASPISRAMLHDPLRYPNPESFCPERFIASDGTLSDDDLVVAFGFGRRSVRLNESQPHES